MHIIRKPSCKVSSVLKHDFFDEICIDGNHNLSNVLKDAVFSYRKLKPNGYLIMDDNYWGEGDNNVNAYTKDKWN